MSNIVGMEIFHFYIVNGDLHLAPTHFPSLIGGDLVVLVIKERTVNRIGKGGNLPL
jgi:hypothetical protein